MFRTVPLSIISSLALYTQQQSICHGGYADCLLASSQHNLCVQCWTPDDGQRNSPKHVNFYQKILKKLVNLVGFIIRLYHDARSSVKTYQLIKVMLHIMDIVHYI